MSKALLFFFITVFVVSTPGYAQQHHLQYLLDSLRVAGQFPGLSVSYIKGDNPVVSLVSGYADPEQKIPLSSSDLMMQGSVGKTYAAAIAVRFIQQGRLGLDEKVSKYLGTYNWFKRLPNAESITVRMILNHSSGIMRYEFKPDFLNDLTANPAKSWKPEELLQYVFDEKANFAAGEGWEYSDTNYILLGMILEKISGREYYKLLSEELLQPLQLSNTKPSNGRRLPGLIQGYAGDQNEFGGKDKVIGDDGLFIFNPQFEWTGGGIYSTTSDLARWGKALYEGRVTDTSLMLSAAVPAKLGKDSKYGLGVIIKSTPIGISYGHSGFFPGYLTELQYFPEYRLSIAIQSNSSDFRNLKISLARCLAEFATRIKDSGN